MKTQSTRPGKEGAILLIIMIMLVVLSIIVLSLYRQGQHSSREAEYEVQRAQAFWLAEAGRQWCVADLYDGGDGTKGLTTISDEVSGEFMVEEDPDDRNYFISTGIVTVGGRKIVRSIRLGVAFVAAPFDNAIYGGNVDGADWTLQLSGTQKDGTDGPPLPQRYRVDGGNDVVRGDVDVNGNVYMREDSMVTLPDPNRYDVKGDVDAGDNIYLDPSGPTISGQQSPHKSATEYTPPNLADMEYEKMSGDKDFNIAKIFADYEARGEVVNGRLPEGHPLHDVVAKNVHPSGSDPTPDADDYYFEPSSISSAGSRATGETPLVLGDDTIYYVDGHVWFHNRRTYGFEVDGQSVIVSTRDIHISDNINYKDTGLDGDLLALVALGQYTGDARSGYGDIYFGDPKYGTLYSCDAFMFANNNFYYNTAADTGDQMEPESGFKVFGNFMANNQVFVLRDWYTDENDKRRAARYVPNPDGTSDEKWIWVDAVDYADGTTTRLTSDQLSGLRHYAMEVGYDDRIRDAATQMRGLPRGDGTIFAGIISWEEI